MRVLQLPNDSRGVARPRTLLQCGSKAVWHVNLCQLSVSNRRGVGPTRAATATATYANAAAGLPLATATRCSPLDACNFCCCCCCFCCIESLITAIGAGRLKSAARADGLPSRLMGCTIVLIAQMTRRSRQHSLCLSLSLFFSRLDDNEVHA